MPELRIQKDVLAEQALRLRGESRPTRNGAPYVFLILPFLILPEAVMANVLMV